MKNKSVVSEHFYKDVYTSKLGYAQVIVTDDPKRSDVTLEVDGAMIYLSLKKARALLEVLKKALDE